MFRCLLLVAILLPVVVLAQQPYSFVLGQDELAAADIYGIDQTPDGTYWFTTDKGLYSYNGYTFQHYLHPAQLSSSLFNPKVSKDGTLYCNNISGQIFKIVQGELVLHHTVPDRYLNVYIDFELLDEQTMVVFGLATYILKQNEINLLKEENYKRHSVASLSTDCEGNVLAPLYEHFFLRIGLDAIDTLTTAHIGLHSTQSVSFQCLDQKLLYIHSDSLFFSVHQGKEIQFDHVLTTQGRVRRYRTRNGLWLASNKFGAARYNFAQANDKEVMVKELDLLPETFVSHVFVDSEGNTLFGTFGEGIIVFPKTAVEEEFSTDLQFAHIAGTKTEDVYLADKKGDIYLFDATTTNFRKIRSNPKSLHYFSYSSNDNTLFFQSDGFVSLANDTGEEMSWHQYVSSVKNVVQLRDKEYLLSTNDNLAQINLKDNTASVWEQYKLGRTHGLSIAGNGEVAVSTSNGVFVLDTLKQHSVEVRLRDQRVITSELAYYNDKLYVASAADGLLVQEGDSLRPYLTTANGLSSNHVTLFKFSDDHLYIASEKGFQIFDHDKQLLTTLGVSDGVRGSRLRDFEVTEKYLWLLNVYGLQRVAIEALLNEKLPDINMQLAVVADGKKLSLPQNFALPYHNGQLSFEISAPSLAKQGDIMYSYRIAEIHTTWTNLQYSDNKITYNALAPGNYTFEVKLLFKNKELDYKKIDFSVRKPFWLTPVFLAALIAILSLAFYFIFKNRLRKLKQRAEHLEELNNTKLVALHFVFNALDAIQSSLINNESKQALAHLSDFARLMRQVLQHSREKYIALEEEIIFLEYYLKVKKSECAKSFSYNLLVDEGLDEENLFLPPMFIQPFVENAIVHGLRPTGGSITIQFKRAKAAS